MILLPNPSKRKATGKLRILDSTTTSGRLAANELLTMQPLVGPRYISFLSGFFLPENSIGFSASLSLKKLPA